MQELFKDHTDYWQIADTIKNVYFSDGTLSVLMDFERCLDELDIYAFKNWIHGELIAGPDVGKYRVTCTFMWPEKLMPDPRGPRRMLPFGCTVKYRRVMMKVPVKIEDPSDYRPGTHKAKITAHPVWLVEISMPKALMSEIRTGSIAIEDEEVDLQDIDQAYEQDLDNEEVKTNAPAQQPPGAAPVAAPGGFPPTI